MRACIIPLLLFCASTLFAQTGAHRPDISWQEFETEHFRIIYHEGLDSAAQDAARVAEAIYPVVTGNLRTPLTQRTPIYLSDLDEVPNAFAMADRYIFIWMRGILDDMPRGGIRSGGHSKWLRSVITHEFTHIVVAYATRHWTGFVAPAIRVPRWFNEGTARFMEPDGWTSDVDLVVRMAAVNAELDYTDFDKLDGYLLYESGHSIVRYMSWRFGDSTIARILKGEGSGFGSYDFEESVKLATGRTMDQIYNDWLRTVTVLSGSHYGVREETEEISPSLTRHLKTVSGIRYSPDGKKIAILGSPDRRRDKLFICGSEPAALSDSADKPGLLSDEPGFDSHFSWSPDGSKIVLSKLRYGSHTNLVHDLYILDVNSECLERLSSDASLSDPSWSPDGREILAVEKRIGRDRLVLVDPQSGATKALTNFEGDVQVYTPSWSPDGSRIAFSIFDSQGRRAIATINRDGSGFRMLTNDSANNRYPVWSPDGGRIAFTSHANGIPNLQVINSDGSDRHYLTDVAGGIYSVQWKPGSDSVLVISFDSYTEILPHLIPASRRVTPVADPGIREKYTAWQKVAFPQQVPAPQNIPAIATGPVSGYSSLAHISPIASVPLVGTDISREGEPGLRLGLFSILHDPMRIHTLSGLVDYGPVSGQASAHLGYENNYFPFSILADARYLFGFTRVLNDRSYYEREQGGSLGLRFFLPAPNSLFRSHHIILGGAYRDLQPWNTPEFESSGIKPAKARLAILGANYIYSSPSLYFGGSFERSEPKLGSSIQYNRLDLLGAWNLSFGAWSDFSLLTRVEGAAQWGEQLPQEFLGFDKYDQFQGGFSVSNLKTNYRVRGIQEYIYGDRVLIGSTGLQYAFFPGLISGLAFVEAGSAWFEGHPMELRKSYGSELRLNAQGTILTMGVAFEMKENPRSDFYIRLVTGL